MSWTDERVETLKKMWAEGQSASQIAKELGGVTRNAVIGKVHRLGLSNRVAAGEEAAEAAPVAAAPSAPAAAAPAPRVRACRPARRACPASDPARASGGGRTPRACACACRSPRGLYRRGAADSDAQGDHPPPASRCRRSHRPMKSRPRLWLRCARSKSTPKNFH